MYKKVTFQMLYAATKNRVFSGFVRAWLIGLGGVAGVLWDQTLELYWYQITLAIHFIYFNFDIN